MYFKAIKRMSLTGFVVCLSGVLAGCNVSGFLVDNQPPAGSVILTADSERDSAEPIDITVADMREVDLVETLATHRTAYRRTLKQLRAYYAQTGYAHKAKWAAFELKGLNSVKAFRYMEDAEIPSAALRPEADIEEANVLYEKGLELMKKGGHGVPALYREDVMVEAAQVFRHLIEKYPNSDKIDDAAFMCGEIHKEYMPDQELLAVKWYERSWTWDPHTPHPARFQAAMVYDYRLHDRDRALELYQGVVRYETEMTSNVRFATRRIHELTADTRSARAASRRG